MDDTKTPEAMPPKPNPSSPDGKVDFTQTVIVADDVEDARNYIKKILDNIGLNVILCSNGKELMGIVTAENARFDLILLDLSMPEMNGLEVLQALQDIKKKKSFKVCILSGHNDPKVITRASELHADDFLTKPFDKAIFLNRVRNLLGMGRTELAQFAYVQAKFPAAILKLPIMATFNIVGFTEEGITMESAVNIKPETILTIASKSFCEAVGVEQEFNIRILKKINHEGNKYTLSAAFVGMTEAVANKIRTVAVRNAKSSSSVFS